MAMVKVRGYKKGRTSYLVATVNIPAFVGTDMNEYAPFEAGEIIKVPEKIETLLVARNLAVRTIHPEKVRLKRDIYFPLEKPPTPIPDINSLSERFKDKEREFIRALAIRQKQMDAVPILDIKDDLGVSTEEISEIAKKLSLKGDIYFPRHGLIRLTRLV